MSRAYTKLAFTPAVKGFQERYGSRGAYARQEGEAEDMLSEHERSFIESIDGFYLASLSESGWPYVQFRGGRPGFLKVLNPRTLAFLDLRGNKQYLSVGNISVNDKVSLFLMDYANQRRLKIWGKARLEEDVSNLFPGPVDKRVERAMVISVAAFDWNCPQHIPRRFTLEQLEALGVIADSP